MWRSEKGLESWLDRESRVDRSSRGAWLRKLSVRHFAASVRDGSLSIPARSASLDTTLAADTNIVDGLGMLSVPESSERQPQAAFENCGAALPLEEATDGGTKGIHSAPLLSLSSVQDLAMPDSQRAAIRQGRMIPLPDSRSWECRFRRMGVHSLETFREQGVKVTEGYRMFLTAPAVRSGSHIYRMPHRRKSVDLARLKDSDRRSYLHEAEILKSVPAERAELLAVFTGIPIELISRLRFLAGRKEILYSITSGPGRTQTNLHDIAAVRDNASQEVHLVPHRTRSRRVLLATHPNPEGI
jgi:hypothetical protein